MGISLDSPKQVTAAQPINTDTSYTRVRSLSVSRPHAGGPDELQMNVVLEHGNVAGGYTAVGTESFNASGNQVKALFSQQLNGKAWVEIERIIFEALQAAGKLPSGTVADDL